VEERKSTIKELDLIAQDMRELEILYERYFAGEEKREPLKKREDLRKKMRRFANRRIIQTDLRYRYESLSARFFTYSTHWDRILRLMDEGRYVRHLKRTLSAGPHAVPAEKPIGDNEQVYQELLKAHQQCALMEPPPDRDKFTAFLTRQRAALESKYAGQKLEFRVVTENGKPKIKVRAKTGS
jgi:hypothetical protein